METETFLSGYCRSSDGIRLVAVVHEDGRLLDADCRYGSCPHEPNCQIAQKIRELLEESRKSN